MFYINSNLVKICYMGFSTYGAKTDG